MEKRVKRYTKKQHDEAIKMDPLITSYNRLKNDRRPWEVKRFVSRNPLVLLPA